MEELQELPPFLSHESPAVRKQAVEIIAGFSTSSEHQKFFATMEPPLIPRLRSCLSDDDEDVAKITVQAMINLGENHAIRDKMITSGTIDVTIGCLKKRTNPFPQFHLMLLQNLTVEQKGARKLAQSGTALEGLNTRLLLQWFADKVRMKEKDDPFQYVGNVLTNLTQVDSVRKLLVDKERDMLAVLKEQLKTRTVNRRLSTLRIFKNLLMDTEAHALLLNEEVGLWSEIMLLIVGPEALDDDDTEHFIADVLVELGDTKRRDPSLQVRRFVLDIIDMCLSHKPSRIYLKKTGTYVIVRELHKYEKAQEHSTAVMEDIDAFIEENLVQFLCRPEEGEPELGPPPSAAEAAAKKKKELPEDEREGNNPNNIAPDHPGLLRF